MATSDRYGITVTQLIAFLEKFEGDAIVSESTMVFVTPTWVDHGTWWELSFPSETFTPTVVHYVNARPTHQWPLANFVPVRPRHRYEMTVWITAETAEDAGQLVVDALTNLHDEHNVSVGSVNEWRQLTWTDRGRRTHDDPS